MNIFKILSSGDGSIHEPNVSSFLSYLLETNQGHGLNSKVLERFLAPVILENPEAFKGLIYKGRVCDLSANSKFTVTATTEFPVKTNHSKNDKQRDIDILIEIYQNGSLPKFAFCIENKINDGAASDKNQLIDEIDGLINYYNELITEDSKGSIPEIGLIFLTPNYSNVSTKHYNNFLNQLKEKTYGGSVKSVHLTWTAPELPEHNNNSVFYQLSEILREESLGLVDPIHEYTKYTIKSFMNFILTGFRSYKEEKKMSNEKTDYGKTIREFFNEVYEDLSTENIYSPNEIKDLVFKKVYDWSGKPLNSGTSKAHLTWFIINEKNRCSHNAKNPTDDSINLFYYIDSSKKLLKKLDLNNPPADVKIYWKDSSSKTIQEAFVSDFYPKK